MISKEIVWVGYYQTNHIKKNTHTQKKSKIKQQNC